MARQSTDVKGAAPNASRGRPVPRVFADSERASPLWSLRFRTDPPMDRETSCTLNSADHGHSPRRPRHPMGDSRAVNGGSGGSMAEDRRPRWLVQPEVATLHVLA